MTTITIIELRKKFNEHLQLNDTPIHAINTLIDDVHILMYIQHLMIHEQITISEMFTRSYFIETLHEQIYSPKTIEKLIENL